MMILTNSWQADLSMSGRREMWANFEVARRQQKGIHTCSAILERVKSARLIL
jgi:hypothetical protein